MPVKPMSRRIEAQTKPILLRFCHEYAGFVHDCSFDLMLLCRSGAAYVAAQTVQIVDLPTSKQLIGEIPGHPQRLNSLPMSMTVSPDGRYVVTVNAGYGTFESMYEQSLAVLNTQTGVLADFPDDRTPLQAKQTLYSGLAFSRDGSHIYASMGSVTNPEGDGKKATGSGVVVYSFKAGKIAPERFIPLPLQQLAPGRKTKLIGGVEGDKGVPFPAAIAVLGPARSRARKGCWWRITFPTMCCCWTLRRARSRSDSILRRATPFLRHFQLR